MMRQPIETIESGWDRDDDFDWFAFVAAVADITGQDIDDYSELGLLSEAFDAGISAADFARGVRPGGGIQ